MRLSGDGSGNGPEDFSIMVLGPLFRDGKAQPDRAYWRRFHARRSKDKMRIIVKDAKTAKRPVNVTLSSDLVAKAREEGLNLSALAEEAVVAALARAARARFEAEIAQACKAHEQYLAEYGILGDAVWAETESDEPA
jgi:antitoxin CcdA